MIKSVYHDHDECLSAIMELCGIEAFSLDPTYSTGNFYKNLPEPILKSDIEPQVENVMQMDCRALDFRDNSLQSIIFDPPFLATKGPSLKTSEGNVTARRFRVYDTETQLHKMYYDSLIEFYRVLRPGGFLAFKCQDKVSSGKQYFSHVYIHNWAHSLGFYPKDLMIYVHKNRISAAWQSNQQHARKFHCYWWVFQKVRPKVNFHELVR